ncbi:MAG: DUF4129 domain-containing protein [Chloroflexota bacterium]
MLLLNYALIEIALLAPVSLVLMGWARYWPPGIVALWLGLLMFLPLNLIRFMSVLRFGPKIQRRVMFVALLLTIILSWRILYSPNSFFDFAWLRQFTGSLAEDGNLLWARDLSVFAIISVAWWRGIRLAGRTPDINNAGLRLRVGGLILAPVVIWLVGRYTAINIVPFILLFFLAGLTTVALVRAEQIEQEQQGTASTLNARWFSIVFVAALLIVVAGGSIAAFIGGESLFVILGWFSPVWRAIQFGALVSGAVLLKLASPALELFGTLIQFLAGILASLLGRVSEALRESGLLEFNELSEFVTPTITEEATTAGATSKYIVVFFMLLTVLVVSLALARAYRQATFAARESSRSRTEQSDLTGAPGFARRFLERLWILRQWRTAASIRRIYKQMCQTAASNGFPRLEAETPYEYLPVLASVWPDYTGESRLITEAFVRVRYGEIPESETELDEIRQAWARLAAIEPQRQVTEAKETPALEKRE